MFEETWKENTNDTGSPRIVQALNWDKQALLIILNIIHGRTRAVPRHIDLEMLAKIAVMVDYYGCLEAVEHFVEVWRDNLKEALPTTYSRELVLHMTVASMFRHTEDLEQLSSTCLRVCRGPIDPLDLPISHDVIGESPSYLGVASPGS